MRKAIIILVVVLVLAAGGYFLFSMLFVTETPTVAVLGVTDTNFLTAVFSEPKFEELKQFVPSPIEVGQTGKIDPFMKF